MSVETLRAERNGKTGSSSVSQVFLTSRERLNLDPSDSDILLAIPDR
jgi:hypothetical protein